MRLAIFLTSLALSSSLLGCSDTLRAGYDATGVSLAIPLEAGADPDRPRVDQPDPTCRVPQILASCQGGLCRVPAGCFVMGSSLADECRNDDELVHQVTLSHDLLVADHEVTQSEFLRLTGYNPSTAGSCGGDCPVESLSWHQAAAYTNALSTSAGLEPCYSCRGSGALVACTPAPKLAAIYDCRGYRLPTEAEWEYAYRAGNTGDLYNGPASTCFGDDPLADRIGWYRANAVNAPHPVGKKDANAWGLRDMAGNIAEWIHDGYAPYPTAAGVDPSGAISADLHSLRGGSWFLHVKEMRAASRSSATATRTDPAVGFRAVRAAP